MLKVSGQKLCGALGAVFDEDAWRAAATKAMELQERMLRSSADKSCDNRLAWRALIDSGGTDEPVASVVLVYFST